MQTEIEATCQNCSYPIKENFCPNCGLPTKFERIDRNYALQEGINLFGFEKGFLYTIRELLLRPAQTTHNYLTKNRYKYTKPLAFILATSAIYTFVAHYFRVETILQEEFANKLQNPRGSSAMQWIQDNYGYANILSTVFIIFWMKIFFKKYHYNTYEIAVLLFFVMGEAMLFYIFIPLNTKYLHSAIVENLLTLLIFLYTAWAIGQFFGSKFSNYVKAFFAYLIGFMTFMIVATIVGIVYELMIR